MKPKFLLYLFLTLSLFSIQLQCDRDEDIPVPVYEFAETVTIAPYRLDYTVGDTIWLSVRIPGKKFFDTKTNTRVFIDSADIYTNIGVRLVYNNPFIADGPFAQFIFKPGVVSQTQNAGGSTFAYVNFGCAPATDYETSVGIVLIHKGIFSVHFDSNYLYECFTRRSKNASLKFSFDVTDTHKNFYQSIPFSNIGRQQDAFTLNLLDRKQSVIINVQ